MGFLGLGSTLTMLRMKYGSKAAVEFTERVARELALAGWEAALELAEEKGPAPIMDREFEVTEDMLRKRPEMRRDGWRVGDKVPGRMLHARYSRYMQRVAEVAPELVAKLAEVGARFTHHSSIAPTGTISLSLANNASNGIEPSFAHHYFRNVIREGRKTKEKVDVFSFELLAYRRWSIREAAPDADEEGARLPDYFITADDITPDQHVDIQAAAQNWVDSSISKTANVPTDFPYEDFKDIYLYAYEKGLKGCTTFRFNPEAFQGVLVKEKDLENTTYVFTLDDGSEVEVRGDEEVEYDGETHTAANLYRRAQGRLLRQVLTAACDEARAATAERISNMSATKIGNKIVGYTVARPEEEKKAAAPKSAESKVVRMHEKLERPELLLGSTYKVKTPISEHAMYVTINDIVLNLGTGHEQPPALRDLHQLARTWIISSGSSR